MTAVDAYADPNAKNLQRSDEGQDERVAFGVSSMQGWRISMEDAHACVLDLQPEPAEGQTRKAAESDVRLSFFGVYDGHGGDKVAIYTGENLHNIVAKQDGFKDENIEQALKDGFLAADRAILSGQYRRNPRGDILGTCF
jgi:protein phosphatase PTC2/3